MRAHEFIPVGTRFRAKVLEGRHRHFPHVSFLPAVSGLRFFDGSGSEERVQQRHQMVVNSAPDCRGLEARHAYTTMESCRAYTLALALMPEMLDLVREVAELRVFTASGLATRAKARGVLAKLDVEVGKRDGD